MRIRLHRRAPVPVFVKPKARVIGLREQRRDVGVDDARRLPVHRRPKTRGDCENGPRPCPYLACRHHLQYDVAEDGTLRRNFETLEEMVETCSLDVAARGGEVGPNKEPGLSCEQTGRMINLTRERVRQIEAGALEKLKKMRESFTITPDEEDDGEPGFASFFGPTPSFVE